MSALDMVSLDNAEECENNWKRFDSFAIRDPEVHEGRFIFYTSNRGSGLCDLSNERAIKEFLDPFMFVESEDVEPDVIEFGASHWAVGYVDGFSLRVFKQGTTEPTEAFKCLCEIAERLADYPLLDEEDHSRREYEATLENIGNEGRRLFDKDAPEGWEVHVFRWLWNNNQGAIENTDDQGGYPSEDNIKEALIALLLIEADEEEEVDG
jgi:hypothetical protein